jgi:hypothetical protein
MAENTCPSTPDMSDGVVHVLEPSDTYSELNARNSMTFTYQLSHTTNQAGAWYFEIENSKLPSCATDATDCIDDSISVLAVFNREYTCSPACENNGLCSQHQDNTCICQGTGFTGAQCTMRMYTNVARAPWLCDVNRV